MLSWPTQIKPPKRQNLKEAWKAGSRNRILGANKLNYMETKKQLKKDLGSGMGFECLWKSVQINGI